jgi:5-dehydro-2-deoxygluconokinase
MPDRPQEAATKPLDVITIGRCSVDLYGQQIGSRLEDITSFAKSVGGCPSNIAIGTARLGLKSGLVTRVGNEQFGRFILEQMQREGVALTGIHVDPVRLTALAILSVESDKSFPLLFYRENCADIALDETDIDESFIASARAIVVTGTHFSKPNTDAAQRKAMRIARNTGSKVVFDIDYRPNLWGLAGHAAGDERYIKSDTVSAHLRALLPQCDLIVGTEEEVHIAAGLEDTRAALAAIRALTPATIVLKRGPMGCVVFDDAIPASIDDGIVGKGFPIEVYNVLGAGDAFMSGFLRGWLKGESLETAATFANACGAFAVSRLLCSPESPTFEELSHFLEVGSPHRALRKDPDLNHLHWATTRRPQAATLMALAIDESAFLEELADLSAVPRDTIVEFEALAVTAVANVAGGEAGLGVVLRGRHSPKPLYQAAAHRLWIGRPLEEPDSLPLEFEGPGDLGSRLVEFPIGHTTSASCLYHPADEADLQSRQERELSRLHAAARGAGRELLIGIMSGGRGPVGDDTVAMALERLYALGIEPDWWRLGPQTAGGWAAIERVVRARDPHCRGILVGLDTHAEKEVRAVFAGAAGCRLVQGFIAGRPVIEEAARAWFVGRMDDEAAIAEMARRYGALVTAWRKAAGPSRSA